MNSIDFQTAAIYIIRQGVELEYQYALATIPRGILGLNAQMFSDYLEFVAKSPLPANLFSNTLYQ